MTAEVIWNSETLAGREYDDLPEGTLLVSRSATLRNLSWVVQIKCGKDWVWYAAFWNQDDALAWAKVHDICAAVLKRL